MIKANIAFAQFVNTIMIAERVPHSDAWQRAAQRNPDLNTLMLALGATRDRVGFVNSRHQAKVQQPGAAARIEARDEFIAKVHAKMKRTGLDYDAAWSSCQREFGNAASNTPSPAGHSQHWLKGDPSTSAAPGFIKAPPKFKDYATLGNVTQFCLPPGTSQEVFDAAVEANGNQNAVIHFAKVFDGLVNYFMESKKMSHGAAIDYCKGQFPDLWKRVKELSQIN